MSAAARVCADQHAAPQVAGHLRQCHAGHLDVIGGRVRSRVPGAEHEPSALAEPSCPSSANTVRGWKLEGSPPGSAPPGPSPSTRSRPWRRCPPGSSSPSAQPRRPGASSQHAPGGGRAERITRSAPGAFAASLATSRQTTGSDASSPEQLRLGADIRAVGQAVTASASATPRSATTFPGSWTPAPGRHRASHRHPTILAGYPRVCASSRPPAWDPIPSVSGPHDLGAAGGKLHLESASRTGADRSLDNLYSHSSTALSLSSATPAQRRRSRYPS